MEWPRLTLPPGIHWADVHGWSACYHASTDGTRTICGRSVATNHAERDARIRQNVCKVCARRLTPESD